MLVQIETSALTIKTAAQMIKEAQTQIRCVSIDEAKALIEGSDDFVILDVREADSVAEDKLADSTHISRGLRPYPRLN